MTHNFVKIFDPLQGQFNGWFLELSEPSLTVAEHQMLQDTMLSTTMTHALSGDPRLKDLGFTYKLKLLALNDINYNALVQKYGTIYIRQVGSWMTMSKTYNITDYCQAESWPTDNSGAEIVICENDIRTEKPWVEYLQKNFPGKNINVLNTFRHRTLGDIGMHFETASTITFYTTFSNLDWFAKLMLVAGGLTGKTIIGYCIDPTKWETVQEQFGHQIDQFKERGNKFVIINSLTTTDQS